MCLKSSQALMVVAAVAIVLAPLGLGQAAAGESAATQSSTTQPAGARPMFGGVSWRVDRPGADVIDLEIAVSRCSADAAMGQAFGAELLESVRRAIAGRKQWSDSTPPRARRALYADVYPWVLKSGEPVAQIVLFADGDAFTPIFSNDLDVLRGTRGDVRMFAQRAATIIVNQVDEAIAGWPTSQPETQPSSEPARPSDVPRWRLAEASANQPPLRFHFAPPVEGYGGFIGEFEGECGASPWEQLSITARVKSIDMGERDLTESINTDVHLDTERFPSATFRLEHVQGAAPGMIGKPKQTATLVGVFSMKGVSVPLFTRATKELYQSQGAWRMRLRGSFRINIADFGLFPPEGPAPAQHTVVMEYDFVFMPSE